MCVVHHKLTLVFRSMTGFERVLLDSLFEKSMENHFWKFGVLLSTAPLVPLKAGAQGISIAVAFRSFDRTLQMYFSNRF